MRFTPNNVFAAMKDRSPRFRETPVSPDQLSRLFTDGLRKLVERVTDYDEERLATRENIDNTETVSDPDQIDITFNGTLDWLRVNSVDFRTASGDVVSGEVVLGTQEARHRLKNEFAHLDDPVGYIFDRNRLIWKVDNWDQVFDLEVWGVLVPARITANDWTTVFEYPRPVYDALAYWMLIELAEQLRIQPNQLQRLIGRYTDELEDLSAEARDHSYVIEDVPHLSPDY